MKKYPTLLDRIIANSVLSDLHCCENSWCWLWTGGVRKHASASYGVLNIYKDGRVVHLSAHRAAIVASGRRLGANQVARHKCDNPQCVNPAHLVVGTQSQNLKDQYKRGRRG